MVPPAPRRVPVLLLAFLAAAFVRASPAGAIEPSRVLVVYNHLDPDSLAVRNRYAEARPGVLDFNLASRELLGRHTVTHDEFRRAIRAPLRARLSSSPDLASRVVCIVLTKGIPHRIADDDRPDAGDDPAEMRREWLERGDFTAASVDSELTLLWQELDRNERGGAFDSVADGFVLNPFHGERRAIGEFPREAIRKRKRFGQAVGASDARGRAMQGGWASPAVGFTWERLTPGDIYLVARLDGPTLESVFSAIDRAAEAEAGVDPTATIALLDGNPGALDRGDYARATKLLLAGGWNAIHDDAPEFVECTELPLPLIAYAGYGRNDGARVPADYIACFRLAPGAVFNTLESFNGRAFGGLGDRAERPQTQLSDFVAAGGTYGVGNVWEPFSFSAAENELLLDAMLNRGATFVEAAYSSLRALSWQQIVVGDPLGRIRPARDATVAPASRATEGPREGAAR